MSEENKINPGHDRLRRRLRVIGPAVGIVGLLFTIVGVGNFFWSFHTMEGPRFFWCVFLGLPLMFVGGVISQFAFMGAVTRFTAGETAPVAKDTFNYLATGTRDGVREITSAVAQGLHGGSIKCHSCGESNDMNAKFCDNCGQPIGDTKTCSNCSTENDQNARYCDHCGREFPTAS